MSAPRRLPTVILISGRGSNLHAILRAVAGQALPIDIRAVISNRPDAPGLTLARNAGITAEILDHTAFPNRQSFDNALQALIDRHTPELVVLAGFMRILSPSFVSHYHGRMLNIHPSLLPAFTGLDTHRRVLEAGEREHGASVHFVTHALDGGPVVLAAHVPVLPGDTAATLGARVLEAEHRIYPQAIRWFAEGRLHLAGDAGNEYALLDGKRIAPELIAQAQSH